MGGIGAARREGYDAHQVLDGLGRSSWPAALESRDRQGTTPLLLAARSGATRTPDALRAAGASLDALDGEGRGAFHLAALEARDAAVTHLIALRMPLEARTTDGRTPARRAEERGRGEIAAWLRSLPGGAD